MVCELQICMNQLLIPQEIFEMNLLKPRPALAFGHMEVRIDAEALEVNEQITYLYKWVDQDAKSWNILTAFSFREGRSTSSFGTW